MNWQGNLLQLSLVKKWPLSSIWRRIENDLNIKLVKLTSIRKWLEIEVCEHDAIRTRTHITNESESPVHLFLYLLRLSSKNQTSTIVRKDVKLRDYKSVRTLNYTTTETRNEVKLTTINVCKNLKLYDELSAMTLIYLMTTPQEHYTTQRL